MVQPRGFVKPQCPHHFCKLYKDLYGVSKLLVPGFNASTLLSFVRDSYRSCRPLFFTFHHGTTHLILLFYVDDIVLTRNDLTLSDDLWIFWDMNLRLRILVLFTIFWVLRFVFRLLAFICLKRSMFLTYWNEHIWFIVNLQHSYYYSCSIVQSGWYTMSDPNEFHHLLVSLQYFTLTCSDIAYVINNISHFMSRPT